jgi:LysM repeat protein
MIFVAVLLLVVLVVAASRPFLSERLIPAALGWDRPISDAPPPVPTLLVPTMVPASTETPAGDEVVVTPAAPAATVTPLPAATPSSYQVLPGDNLTRIARQFGVSVEALAQANGLSNPNQISPGDVLIIPTP